MGRMNHMRVFWAIEYVNSREFIGRYEGQWNGHHSIDGALLFSSQVEAERALESFRQECQDRIANGHAVEKWFKWAGGLLTVVRIEQMSVIASDSTMNAG
jgi:hypothetical protein